MMHSVETLSNGLISVLDRASRLRGTYTRDGRYLHGDLRTAGAIVRAYVTTH